MFADKQIICLKRHAHLEASLQKEPTSFVSIERTISLIYHEKLHRFFLVAYLSTSNMMNVCNMFFQSSIYVKITILTQIIELLSQLKKPLIVRHTTTIII